MSLVRGVSWVMVIRVAGAVLTYLSHVVLARWLGVEAFGIFAYAWVWVTIIGFVAPIGISGAVVKFLPDYVARRKWPRAHGLIHFSRIAVLTSGILTGGLFAAAIFLLGGSVPEHYRVPLYLAALAIPLIGLIDLFQELSRSFDWMRLAYFPNYVLRPGALLLLVGVIVATGAETTATTAMLAALTATLITLTLQLILFRRRLPEVLPPAARRFRHGRHWVQAAFPFLFIEASYLVLENTDVIMLGYFMAPEDVALYYAVIRTTSLIGFITFAVSALAAPRFATLHAKQQFAELRAFYHHTIHLTFWPSLVVGVVLLLSGNLILSAFGTAFTDGYPLLVLLVVAILFEAAFGPVAFLLNMTGQQIAAEQAIMAVAVLNIVFNALLIPVWGLSGATAATALSIVLRTILFVALSRRVTNSAVQTAVASKAA